MQPVDPANGSGRPHHSALMPAVWITLPHFSVSSATNAAACWGRHHHRFGPERDQPRPDGGIGEHGVGLAAEGRDDLGRHVSGSRDRIPDIGCIAGQDLADRRHVAQHVGALRAGHAEWAQPALRDEVERRRDRGERRLHLAGEQIGQVGVAIRHMHEVDAGHHPKQLGRHVRQDGLGAGDEFRHRVHRDRGMDPRARGPSERSSRPARVADQVELLL